VTTPDYRPIACDRYSELELLAMRRARVVALLRGGDGALERHAGRALDLVTRDGAEYLVLARSGADSALLRLDRLLELADPDGTLIWCQNPDASQRNA
jgi:Rho-binding antiterminator